MIKRVRNIQAMTEKFESDSGMQLSKMMTQSINIPVFGVRSNKSSIILIKTHSGTDQGNFNRWSLLAI